MLDHLEPYLLAPSSLTPTALRERADTIQAELAGSLPPEGDFEPVRVRHNFLYDAWLVRWAPGDATDLHAHRSGYQAVTVLAGMLRETTATPDGLRDSELVGGEQLAALPGHTHRLVAGDAGAVSLVLSSPPRPVPPRATRIEQIDGVRPALATAVAAIR